MLTFLRQLFCRHRQVFWRRTVHGDEIILLGYCRTEVVCRDCGKLLRLNVYIPNT